LSASPSPSPFRTFRVVDDSDHALLKDGEPVTPGEEGPGLDDELLDGVAADALEGRVLGYTLVQAEELRRSGGAVYDVAGVGLVVVTPHPSTGELWGVSLMPRAAAPVTTSSTTQAPAIAEEGADQ
jgi:hypothetical protein